MERLKSSRLWMTVVVAALGSVMTQLGMDPETWTKLAAFLVATLATYVVPRSMTDMAKMKAEAKKNSE